MDWYLLYIGSDKHLSISLAISLVCKAFFSIE